MPRCVDPTCISGCPVEINIPKFIKYIERGEFLEAAKTLKETSAACCMRKSLPTGKTMRE